MFGEVSNVYIALFLYKTVPVPLLESIEALLHFDMSCILYERELLLFEHMVLCLLEVEIAGNEDQQCNTDEVGYEELEKGLFLMIR